MKKKRCCEIPNDRAHPDHSQELHRLNRIRGQIEGISKMIEETRYCPDIITQIQAIRAALGSLQSAILSKHLQECVRVAFESKNTKMRDKHISELLALFAKSGV